MFDIKRSALLCLALAACAVAAQAAVPVYGYTVKRSYPHDAQAFTQGLYYQNGYLYESTGQHGYSSLRRVELESGKVLQKKAIPPQYFGEGISPVGNEIVALTWTSQTGFVFDASTFELKRTFSYPGEGWALATDGERLYMSDGTAYIRVLDPKTLNPTRRIRVTADGEPVTQLNELEWVEGEIYANIWQTDRIARIDPFSGRVVGWIDLSGLAASANIAQASDNVLNGIAYDSAKRRLFVTGKMWPKLFEIELKPQGKR